MSKLVRLDAATKEEVVTRQESTVWRFNGCPDALLIEVVVRAFDPADFVLINGAGERLFRFFLNREACFGPVMIYQEDLAGAKLLCFPKSYTAEIVLNAVTWGYDSIIDEIGRFAEEVEDAIESAAG